MGHRRPSAAAGATGVSIADSWLQGLRVVHVEEVLGVGHGSILPLLHEGQREPTIAGSEHHLWRVDVRMTSRPCGRAHLGNRPVEASSKQSLRVDEGEIHDSAGMNVGVGQPDFQFAVAPAPGLQEPGVTDAASQSG